ncbi:uncharacterized protein N7479_000166 [Penicillium vulpinum]|uniref:C2H2-type domain-containing protein n=1 Tax=Penicillium vulpinum TaxID=29845 RepID=A0A1V6RWT4_9EURO|nr:uncharacterized protein N7479_000166 [Penicillium vulpinum]KAJ5970248.1 hypothetical protein N7479_000166 [Penicillium vulpinum]OQE06225.1 hypothetical protein PENVUL_c019G03880 [Penicillium vulpinum]
MAWPSYNIAQRESNPSYGPRWDTSGYEWPQVSPPPPFSIPSAIEPPMFPSHLLYNYHLQHPSMPLYPNFFIPAAPSNLDLYRPNQEVTHYSLLEGNGVANPFHMDSISPEPSATTRGASQSPNCSVQEIHQLKDNGRHSARSGALCRRRGARKPNPGSDGQGAFRCTWKNCRYPGVFSCKGVLRRHIKTQHVTPRSFGCPECDRLFSRKDNMTEHLGRVHFGRV